MKIAIKHQEQNLHKMIVCTYKRYEEKTTATIVISFATTNQSFPKLDRKILVREKKLTTDLNLLITLNSILMKSIFTDINYNL